MHPSAWIQKAIFYGMAFCATFSIHSSTVYATEIQSVEVSVISDDARMPASVKERVAQSILSIGNRVLQGRDDQLFSQKRKSYEKVLKDIIDRVVVGYVVTNLNVDYGTHTMIRVSLQSVGSVVESVETYIDYGNLSPEAIRYVEKDTMEINRLMQRLLIGLPVDSIGWAENVSQSVGRELLANLLPEFDVKFEVKADKNSKVFIYLIPKGEIIRTSRVSFRNVGVPRLLLRSSVEKAENKLKGLEGLPVAFVNRRYKDILFDIENIWKEERLIRKYQIMVNGNLQTGRESILYLDALTKSWDIKGEAWFDISKKENRNYAVHGILGYYINPNDQIFTEAIYYPGPMAGNLLIGVAHRFGKNIEIGGKYDVIQREQYLFGKMQLAEKIVIAGNRNITASKNEFDFFYKLHNYMTIEYVYNSKEGNWLRLIVNL